MHAGVHPVQVGRFRRRNCRWQSRVVEKDGVHVHMVSCEFRNDKARHVRTCGCGCLDAHLLEVSPSGCFVPEQDHPSMIHHSVTTPTRSVESRASRLDKLAVRAARPRRQRVRGAGRSNCDPARRHGWEWDARPCMRPGRPGGPHDMMDQQRLWLGPGRARTAGGWRRGGPGARSGSGSGVTRPGMAMCPHLIARRWRGQQQIARTAAVQTPHRAPAPY